MCKHVNTLYQHSAIDQQAENFKYLPNPFPLQHYYSESNITPQQLYEPIKLYLQRKTYHLQKQAFVVFLFHWQASAI